MQLLNKIYIYHLYYYFIVIAKAKVNKTFNLL